MDLRQLNKEKNQQAKKMKLEGEVIYCLSQVKQIGRFKQFD